MSYALKVVSGKVNDMTKRKVSIIRWKLKGAWKGVSTQIGLSRELLFFESELSSNTMIVTRYVKSGLVKLYCTFV